jgi:hypothetical protein
VKIIHNIENPNLKKTRKKISISNTGKKRTEEQRKNISISHMGIEPPNKGVPMSDEQKIKIGIANTGKVRTEEFIEKMRAVHKGKPKSPESIMKRQETRRINAAKKGKKY